MPLKQKKKPWILIWTGAVLAVYAGYLLNGALAMGGGTFIGMWNELGGVFGHPFRNYFDRNSVWAMLFMPLAYAVGLAMYYTGKGKYMPGREYGSAEMESPEKVTRALGDEEPKNNRIYSQNVRVSLNTRKTKLNNNALIVGGSGAGKTFYEVKPNMMLLQNSSIIATDSKGEISRATIGMFKKNGYNVKVLNLIEMDKSDRYNPFAYIRDETDIVRLVTNIISNTTPKGSAPADPFWDKAESLFLQSIFLYVWLEEPPEKRNFASVMELLSKAEATDGKKDSELTKMFNRLLNTPLGSSHPAYVQYQKCMRGAGDTVRSIIISANSRLAYLQNSKVLNLLSKDDMHLEELGIGVNGDKRTKTVLYCVIPDNDKSYNFIVGMLYTQIFQELYYQADFNYGGRLPIHVTFMLDEFANVALPDDFCSLLSTMRSREISSVIIIQNLAQIKALFKDTWETIPGNCDTLVYLGGNEQSTHKYISELIGKSTIDKRSHSETRSKQGSASRSFDVIGRELLTADEVRKLDNSNCIIFIRGFNPILDRKYATFNDPMFSQTTDGGAEYQEYVPVRKQEKKGFPLLSDEAVKYYEKQQKAGKKGVHVDTISYEDLMGMEDEPVFRGMTDKKTDKTGKEQRQETDRSDDGSENADRGEDEQGRSTDPDNSYDIGDPDADEDNGTEVQGSSGGRSIERSTETEDKLFERLAMNHFTNDQKVEMWNAINAKLSTEEILSFFMPQTSVQQMREYIRDHKRGA